MRYNVTDEASKQRHASAAAPGPSPPGPGGSSPPLVRRRDPSEYMSETEPGRVPRLYDYPPDLEARINAQHDSIDFEHFTSTMNAIVDKQECVLEGVKNILQTPVPHIKSHFLQSDEEKERIEAGRRALLEQREDEGAKQDELMRKFKALMMIPPPFLKARQAASSDSAPSPSERSGLHRAQSEDDSDASINRGTAEEARLIEESLVEAGDWHRDDAFASEDDVPPVMGGDMPSEDDVDMYPMASANEPTQVNEVASEQHDSGQDTAQRPAPQSEEVKPAVGARGRPKSKTKKKENPLPWVVLNSAGTGWDTGMALNADTKRLLQASNANMAGRTKHKEDHARFVRNNAQGGHHCAQCVVIRKNKGSCQLQDDIVACRHCIKNKRPCAKLITHNGESKLAWLPLPEEYREEEASWQKIGYWITR